MAKVPALAVPVAREFLHELGISPRIVKNDGSIDVAALAGEVVHEIEITTALTPPIKKTLQQADDLPPAGGGGTKPKAGPGLGARVGAFLQPTVRIRSIAGEKIIAPFGQPAPNVWKKNVLRAVVVVGGVVVGFVLIGFIGGRLTCGCPRPGKAVGAGPLPPRKLAPPVLAGAGAPSA